MQHDTDHNTDNLTMVAAQEAHRVALRQAARLIHSELPQGRVTIQDVLNAMAHHLPSLYAVGDAHNSMLAAGARKDPGQEGPQ